MKILRPEVEECLISSGGLFDLFDNQMMHWLNITINELNFMTAGMSEDEMDTLMGGGERNFATARKIIEIRNKYLKLYCDTKCVK